MPDIDWKSDLLVGVMNLIESEHHARFSYLMTGDEKWLVELKFCSELRAKHMASLEKQEESQLHCYCKHILSASFRFFEVGDKHLREDRREEAIKCYKDGLACFERFYVLNFAEEEKKGFFDKVRNALKI